MCTGAILVVRLPFLFLFSFPVLFALVTAHLVRASLQCSSNTADASIRPKLHADFEPCMLTTVYTHVET